MLSYKYKKEIALEYGWDRKTLYNKLCQHDLLLPRGFLSPAEQKLIYECLGYPSGVNKASYDEVQDLDDLRA